MNCPNCFEEMKEKVEKRYSFAFGDWDSDYDDYVCDTHYKCKKCGISFESRGTGEEMWDIPERYAPTDKQVKTILFINSRLRLNLTPLTKKQCWKDISKYFDEAKRTPKYTDEDWQDIQDMYGMDFGDFC